MVRRHDRRYEKAMTKRAIPILLLLVGSAGPAHAQVLIRVGQAGRATYSELHEALRPGTAAADSALAILREPRPAVLWARVRAALRGDATWNDAPLALTRLAQLRHPGYGDSAATLARAIEAGKVDGPPGQDPADLLAPLRAVELERARAVRGDAAVLAHILAMIPGRQYGVGEAWVLGRLGRAASDSIQARFLAAKDTELKVRYLTLLSFSADTGAIPLLARVYAAPDSFGIPPRYATRASDALLWIGTGSSLAALLKARGKARARRVYSDPELNRGGYDFLANDSSAVISRTGKWLTEWIAELGAGDVNGAQCAGQLPRPERAAVSLVAQQHRVGPSAYLARRYSS
jgi:hypothetical protein